MFCTNCGELLDDSAVFCTKCGQRVEQTAVTIAKEEVIDTVASVEEEMTVTNTEVQEVAQGMMYSQPEVSYTGTSQMNVPVQEQIVEPVAQKPKKSSKKVWIGLGIVTILLVAAVAVFINFDVLANSARMLTMSPKEYYAHIEKKAVQEMASEFAVSYNNSMDNYMNFSDKNLEYSLDVELGEMLYEMLGGALNLEDASGLSKIGLDFSVSMGEEIFGGEVAARLGENCLISVNALADIGKGMVYAQLPELSERYISVDVSEEMNEIAEVFEGYADITGVYPEGEVWESIVNRYMTIVIDSFEDVTKEKDVVTVGAFEQKGTKLCATMTEEETIDMVAAILTEVKSDNELMDVLVGFSVYAGGADEQMIKDTIIEAIDEYLANMETYKEEADANNKLTMSIWVDNKGEVIGREFAVNKDELIISYQMPQKNKEFGYQLLMGSDSSMFEINGTGTKNAEQMTGDFAVKLSGEEVGETNIANFSIESLNLTKWNEGLLEGSFRIKPDKDLYSKMGLGAASALIENYEIVYEVKSDNSESTVAFSLVDGEELVVKVNVFAKISEADGLAIPSDSILMEDEEKLLNWIATMDFDKFMENLSKSGMPAELVDIIEIYINEFETMVYYD